MERDQLEKLLRFASNITGETEFVLVGSQAALAQLRRLPPQMAMSREIDMYPRHKPDEAEMLDAVYGEGTPFARENGFWLDGVGPETAALPADWEKRAVTFSPKGDPGIKAIAPDINDLAVSKLIAGREKDLEWFATGISTGLVDGPIVASRIRRVPDRDPEIYDAAERRLQDRLNLIPDPEKDALRLSPATSATDRLLLLAEMDDAALLRRMSATGRACQRDNEPGEAMALIEGFKTLRTEAGRRQLLFPEQTPVPTRQKARGAGMSL